MIRGAHLGNPRGAVSLPQSRTMQAIVELSIDWFTLSLSLPAGEILNTFDNVKSYLLAATCYQIAC